TSGKQTRVTSRKRRSPRGRSQEHAAIVHPTAQTFKRVGLHRKQFHAISETPSQQNQEVTLRKIPPFTENHREWGKSG
ncbi:MAG: hypothetical protein ACYCPO_03785, partial [Acidobacteriaceae bacterium]